MSNMKLTAKQNALLQLQAERKKLIEPFLKDDELTEGSYAEVLQKCGRLGCYCEKKPTHLVTRVSKWLEGKLKQALRGKLGKKSTFFVTDSV